MILNLKATWNAVGDSDLAGYYFFNTDVSGTPGPPGAPSPGYWSTAGWVVLSGRSMILKPATQQLFTITISDTPVTGTLYFSLSAVDTNANESARSSPPASYAYNLDTTPPAVPTGLTVIKQ